MVKNNRSNGHNRKKIEKKKLQKTAEKTPNCGFGQSGAYYDEDKQRYIRWSRSDRTKFPRLVKRTANKKIRKNMVPLKGSGYKKIYSVVNHLY